MVFGAVNDCGVNMLPMKLGGMWRTPTHLVDSPISLYCSMCQDQNIVNNIAKKEYRIVSQKVAMVLVVAFTLILTSAFVFAQDRAGDREKADRDRSLDSDRMRDRDRTNLGKQDRTRDRLHMPESSPLRNEDIFGYKLMSVEECNEYRQQLRSAKSVEEREQLRAQHQEKMKARAKAQGMDLAPTSEGPIYGDSLMSAQERNQYREQLRLVKPGKKQKQFIAEHRRDMQARARRRGVQLEEFEEAE